MRHNEELLSLIDDFFSGEEVTVIEMGGLSIAYETAIWVAAFRILEQMIYTIDNDPEIDWEEGSDTWTHDRELIKMISDEICEAEGLTGAQAGAATNAATVLFRQGYDKALDMVSPDRVILLSNEKWANPFAYDTDEYWEYYERTGIIDTVEDIDGKPEEASEVVKPGSTYQLSCPDWPGMGKSIEEMGELGQVYGKIMSIGGGTVYPWGDVDLIAKIEEELSDTLAALNFLISKSPHIDAKRVTDRMLRKYKLFTEWAEGRVETRYEDIEL